MSWSNVISTGAVVSGYEHKAVEVGCYSTFKNCTPNDMRTAP